MPALAVAWSLLPRGALGVVVRQLRRGRRLAPRVAAVVQPGAVRPVDRLLGDRRVPRRRARRPPAHRLAVAALLRLARPRRRTGARSPSVCGLVGRSVGRSRVFIATLDTV